MGFEPTALSLAGSAPRTSFCLDMRSLWSSPFSPGCLSAPDVNAEMQEVIPERLLWEWVRGLKGGEGYHVSCY